MSRKRITQIFPFLLPIREWQKKQFYKIRCYFDKNAYAYEKGSLLRFEVSSTKSYMINENSGYDIKYQLNKVENLICYVDKVENVDYNIKYKIS